MRRLAPIAAFALFLAVPLFAQHGGGGHGGGHGGGFAGHSSFSGGHASGGMRSSAPTYSGTMHSGVSASRGFGRVPYRPGFNGSHFSAGFHHGPINRGPIRNSFRRCFGCRSFIYPWGYGGYYDPWWWNSGYDDSSYDQDYENDRAVADRMNAESLDQQRMLRQEEADGDQDVYADSRAAGSSPRSPRSSHDEAQGSPIMPATVLVFRDQHKQEVQNYAIVGQTLWSFAPQHTQKIPLANLDLAATAKANDENGVTFRVPNAGEAQ